MVRVRQHYNPFSAPALTEPLDLKVLFANPDLPLALEIGPAEGKFLLEYAAKYPERNILGMEIKFKLVESIKKKIIERKLLNAGIVWANANTSLAHILPDNSLGEVYILFPDPWYKERHIKRRVINQKFLDILSPKMKQGGILYIKTDVDFMAEDIKQHLSQQKNFVPAPGHELAIKTKLEGYKEEEKKAVFEFVFRSVL